MAITYPTTLDSLSNPTPTTLRNAGSGLNLSTQISNLNDIAEALEAKVGINSSAVTTSHDYKLSEVTSTDKSVGKTATQTLTNKTLTSPTINTPTISSPVVQDTITGWVEFTPSVTRNSNFVLEITGDYSAVFTKGTKIRYKDGGSYEYGYVISSSFGAGVTTVTLATNTDYTMAAATITNMAYSYAVNPTGFPVMFSFTPTQTGFSANQTLQAKFRLDGTLCTVYYSRNGSDGTSNATTLTFTLPITASSGGLTLGWTGCHPAVDNSSVLTSPALSEVLASATTVSFYKTVASGTWTNSGSKSILSATIQYVI